MEEIWKDVPGYEGLYQVSNLGRVKSYPRLICNHRGCYLRKELIFKLSKCDKGYYRTTLKKENKQMHWRVHKLVAMAFLGHKPCGYKLVVNHIDTNPENNNVNNLELISQRKNANRKHLKSSSKYVGVCFDKVNKKWISQITINKKSIKLGRFQNEYDAHLAYQKKLKEITNEQNI